MFPYQDPDSGEGERLGQRRLRQTGEGRSTRGDMEFQSFRL